MEVLLKYFMKNLPYKAYIHNIRKETPFTINYWLIL